VGLVVADRAVESAAALPDRSPVQPSGGLPAVVRFLQAGTASREPAAAVSRRPASATDARIEARGSQALRDSVAVRSIARYAHQDCAEDDLKKHIWPSDGIARQMVRKAIKAISANPVDPGVRTLFTRYFMTSTPPLGKILAIFDKLEAEFRANDYTYECEDDKKNDRCKPPPDSPAMAMAKAAHGYTWSGALGAVTQAHIHLCMNSVRDNKTNECVASTMVHELSHRYAGTDDHAYCNFCNDESCPSGLTTDDALENADSYSGFAYKLWPMTVG
jgi:hypothetical protein